MAQQYGYKPQKLGYGYQTPSQSPRVSPLAIAAGAKSPTQPDPFGLTSGQAGANGYFDVNPVKPAQPAAHTVVAPQTTPGAAPAAPGAPPAPPAGGAVYDLNTDPALQQANSLIGLNDQQAQAAALKQKQDELLAYGDPTLTAALLGQSDPLVAAAGQNPTSTLKQLGQQHDRGLTDMTENFNKQNLAYSGARVKGEQAFGQDYQNALAQAASGVNQNIGGIDAQLASALAGNNQSRIQALQAAYAAHLNDPGVAPSDAAAATATDPLTDTAAGGYNASGAPDYRSALALAAKTRRNVAV